MGHNEWVKGQNEFWDKWTERQKRNKEKEERSKQLRLEAAAKIALEMEQEVSEIANKLHNESKAVPDVETKPSTKGKVRNRLSLDDALRTFQKANAAAARDSEL